MNSARCECDERATQGLMHITAFALHVGNESCRVLASRRSRSRFCRDLARRQLARSPEPGSHHRAGELPAGSAKPKSNCACHSRQRDPLRAPNAAARYPSTKGGRFAIKNDLLFILLGNDHANHACGLDENDRDEPPAIGNLGPLPLIGRPMIPISEEAQRRVAIAA